MAGRAGQAPAAFGQGVRRFQVRAGNHLMRIEELKRWHWIVIGVVAGGLFALAQFLLRDPADATAQHMKQGVFEHELLESATSHDQLNGQRWAEDHHFNAFQQGLLPRIRDLTVYPPNPRGESLVTGDRLVEIFRQRLDPDNPDKVLPPAARYDRFSFYAPNPYKPTRNGAGAADAGMTVRQYLDRMKADHPDTAPAYRYAWWYSLPIAVAAGVVVGGLLIGGVWPLLLAMLVGAGFGRPPRQKKAAYDLSRFGHGKEDPKPAPAPATVDPAALQSHLDALEADLLANLTRDDATRREEPAAKPASEIKDLKAAPLEAPAAAEAPKEDVEFTGEFYPVAHKVTKKAGE